MRAVLDTNTLVSAVISPNGTPRRLLDAARAQNLGGLHHLVGAEISLDENLEGVATFLFGGKLRDAEFKFGKAA